MSFFKKLKDRLTRSSSKLEEGLDAIVDAGADDAVEARPVHEPLPDPAPEPSAEPPATSETQASPPAPHVPLEDNSPVPVPVPPATAPAPIPAPASLNIEPDAPRQDAPKPGLLGRLVGRALPPSAPRRALDDDMLEQLEELLIASDMGVETAMRVTANL
ncbi:MAG: signal recognition particle receptor subunit alpha, partial [Jannaschia helgolandensis]